MPITTICPSCEHRFEVADNHVGRKGRCGKCKTLFRIAAGQGAVIPGDRVSASPAQAAEHVASSETPEEGDAVPATPPASAAVAAPAQTDEDSVPVEWNEGDVILDLYEVKKVHHGGGMGLVYRVHHRDWDIDLAVKSPRAEHFKTQQHKENFVRECLAWIGLGLHPHIVSCYYLESTDI